MCNMLTIKLNLIVNIALSISDVSSTIIQHTWVKLSYSEWIKHVVMLRCCKPAYASHRRQFYKPVAAKSSLVWKLCPACVQETHCGNKIFESCRPVLECARRCLMGPASRGVMGSPCFLISARHHPPLNEVKAPGLWQIPVSRRCCAPAPRCSTRQPFPYHNCPGSHRQSFPHYPLTNASEPLETPPPPLFFFFAEWIQKQGWAMEQNHCMWHLWTFVFVGGFAQANCSETKKKAQITY